MTNRVITEKPSFSGGVHPPGAKSITADQAIEALPVPAELSILLSQHIGAACVSLVEKGDQVVAGQKIGDSDAFVSAPVHSPVSGKVRQISLRSHAALGRCPAVVIETEARAEQPVWPGELASTRDFDQAGYSAEAILDAVRQAGLVGMGGAGFPTHVKLAPEPAKHTLIINGCECEPYITCDYRLMLESSEKIICGALLAARACGSSQILVAIEDNKPDAVLKMTEALGRFDADGMEVVPVKTKYPQGGERQLIEAVLGTNVPTGGIPPMIGVVVMNVATAAAVADAVLARRPLTHRVVTVTGTALARTGNFYVPLGMSVGGLVDHCGPLQSDSVRVVLGGPMMGAAIADLSTPVAKTTGSVLVLDERKSGSGRVQTPCIRCGRCLQVCPERLNPTRIAHAVKCGYLDMAERYYMAACIECGCCSYVCPAGIPISGHIKTGKILLARRRKKMTL